MSDGRRSEEAIADAAAAWFVRLSSEDAGDEDWRMFERWLAASPAHAEAYDRIERLWVELEDRPEAAKAALQPRPVASAWRGRSAGPGQMPRRWLWPAAAAAMAAAVLVVAPRIERPAKPAATVYATAAGQLRDLALADGSHVRLAPASRLSVTFAPGAREVAMDGEAAFDVTHDPARPFLIQVGDRQVRVVGTEFDLKHRDRELKLTVRRGVVEVRPAGAPSAAPTRVAAGEQLTHADGARTSEVSAVDADEAFGWTVGQLVYRDSPLSEVAADLSRRFGLTISPADAETGRIRFTGVLVADNAPAVLRRLEAFADVKAVPAAGGYVLRRSHEPR